MDLVYSHSYRDPDTGQLIDVMMPDDEYDEEDEDMYRNARRSVSMNGGGGGARSSGDAKQRRRVGTSPPQRRSGPPAARSADPPAPRAPAPDSYRPQPDPYRYEPYRGYDYPHYGPVHVSRDHIALNKQALAELIPAVGQVWASFMARPEPPKAVGDDIVDRENASLHRDALAEHSQNQTRVLALTDLAARALNVFLD